MANQGNSSAEKSAEPAQGGDDQAQLHFYPGDKRLLFFMGIKVVLDIDAWGGPRKEQPIDPGDKFPARPTTPGRFRIGWIGQYLTGTWRFSMLPWGTPIKKSPDLKDFLYESSPGRWESVQRKTGLRLRDVMDRYEELTHKKESPDRWLLNDFGPIAIRYYIDKNNNRKQDKDEALSGEMLHTAPDNELDSSAPLGLSHGCIHIRPLDRQRLMDNQAFKIGTLLIVHRYDEACLVPRRSRGPT